MLRLMFPLMFLALASLPVSMALAEEAAKLFIFKKEGELPRVSAGSVDMLGAANVFEILGEDYVVYNGSTAALSATSSEPVRPIFVPDNDDPVLPLCQCPEDYSLAISEKLRLPQMANLLKQKRQVLAPNAFHSLHPEQVQILEKMILNNGSLILMEQ